MICTLLEANLYPWLEAAGFVNVVLNLMTEEEPTGKMLCVYQKKKNSKTTLEVKCMCVLNNTLSSLRFGLTEYVVFILL